LFSFRTPHSKFRNQMSLDFAPPLCKNHAVSGKI
jgi:hypothetical protein